MTDETLFAAALEKPSAAERQAFVDEACGGDLALRDRVRDLLAADEHARGILDHGATAVLALCRSDSPLVAQELFADRFRLVRKLGEGGMGEVWVADQAEPVRRRVALKVIRPCLDSASLLARFEAERQALALMGHPNIAKVLDAGATDAGRPYFVMELVEGVPITQFCDEHRLTAKARLELFVPICQAVQHAHHKGVIHRDLKPSNILVALVDGKPVPKVIDFGVAKATGPRLTDDTFTTEVGSVVGTLEYMSPEQADPNNRDIDTRADVYALGVILYELLTGGVPFPRRQLHAVPFVEMLRIIREVDPPKPSRRLCETRTAEGQMTAARSDPRPAPRVPRLYELDWIVMKCLEKDRARRYESATGLAADLERYLADQPVLAGPPSAGYRVWKFVRRNRAAVGATALVAVSLGLLAIGAVAFAWQTERQAEQRRAEAADRHGRTAEAVVTLLDQCDQALRADRADQAALALGAAERRAADGGAEHLADRLARARADVDLLRELDAIDAFRWTWADGGLPDPAAVAARWRAALAGVMGRAAESPIRDRVLAALDGWLAADRSPEARAVLRTLDPDPYREAVRNALAAGDGAALAARAGEPKALTQPARFAAVLGQLDAIPTARRRAVLEGALRARPGNLGLLMTLGTSYAPGRRDGAEERLRWFQAAVAAHPESAAAHNSLGRARWDQGDQDGAVADLRDAIRIDPEYARAHYNLGVTLRTLGQIDDAADAYREAARLRPDHAPTRNGLGITLRLAKDLDGAIGQFRVAIRLDGTEARFHANLGTALREKGDAAGARASLQAAVGLDPKLAQPHSELAWVLATGPDEVRDGKKAVEHARAACELSEWSNGGHIDTLAAAYAEAGDFDKALEFEKKALAVPAFAKADGPRGRERLELYTRKKAYRDPALTPRAPGPPRQMKSKRSRGLRERGRGRRGGQR